MESRERTNQSLVSVATGFGKVRSLWLPAILVSMLISAAGCRPASVLYFLFAPDPMTEPRFQIPERNKTVKVVLLASHARSATQTYKLFNADYLIMRKLAKTLEKQFKDNRESVTIVPPHKVQEYKANNPGWDATKSDYEIGKHFKADYVVHLEINKLKLYEDGNNPTPLYRGRADIFISVTNVNSDKKAPPEEHYYSTVYPRMAGEPADFGHSPDHFRARFLDHMAQELTRVFARTPSPTGRRGMLN